MNEWIGMYERMKNNGFDFKDAFTITVRAMVYGPDYFDDMDGLRALVKLYDKETFENRRNAHVTK